MRLPVDEVKFGWSDRSLVAAVTDIVDEQERCPSCGLTDEQAKWVEAVAVRCPTCEALDRVNDKIDRKHGQGVRGRILPIRDPDVAAEHSAHARYTREGAMARFKRRFKRGE